MDNLVEAHRWFAQAEADLVSARDSLSGHHYEWACFQCQQAGEKALKALLYRLGRREIITHSLRDLVRACANAGQALQMLEEPARRLDAFYIQTRYPDSLLGSDIPATYFTKDDGEQCLAFAESILTTVRPLTSA